MNKLIFFLLFLFVQQDVPQFSLVRSIKPDYKNIKADYLGNVYSFSESTIIKYTPNGNRYEYTNNLAGAIAKVDVSNPLKILIFFADFNSILTLDHYLSPIGETVELDLYGIVNLVDISVSLREGVWILNNSSRKAELYDNEFNIVLSTPLINSLTEQSLQNFNIVETSGKLIIYSDTELLLFDVLGKFTQKLTINSSGEPLITQNSIYIPQKDKLILYNLKLHSSTVLPIPEGNWNYLFYYLNHLVTYDNTNVSVFKLSK